MKNILILFGFILLVGLVYSQVVATVVFPPTFNYGLPQLPLPQSTNQTIFTNCPYKFPIELSNVKVFSSNTNQLNPIVYAEIQIYTDNKKSKCSFGKSYTLTPSLTSSELASNLVLAIDAELLQQINANTQAPSLPVPISVSSGGS